MQEEQGCRQAERRSRDRRILHRGCLRERQQALPFSATGESQDREIAKKKARSNAETRLAQTVSATVKAVTDNYVSSTEFNNREEATESFNQLARTVVDQELRGAIAICEKLTQRENGVYVSYVALELSGEKVASKYNEKISEDERIMAEYNYERFKETFQEEMNKLGN